LATAMSVSTSTPLDGDEQHRLAYAGTTGTHVS
jgi:hypothetical protein